jgi:dipeptidyl aminopeptidase/acylaminoacyl peptidase
VAVANFSIAPYGTWKSPITSEAIVAGTIGLGGGCAEGEMLYWSESRPAEGGRVAIVVRSPDGQTQDVIAAPWNARTRVHEYGGGAWTVDRGWVYFTNFADQRLYRTQPGHEPIALTPEQPWRYANFVVDAQRDRLIAVREDHRQPDREPVNELVAIALDGSQQVSVLATGWDFYASPTLSPDGSQLAWLTWQHPNLPWDGTTLWVADVAADGSLQNAREMAGGPEESVFQPSWSPDGRLHFVSDRSGWWNLYRQEADGTARNLCPMEAEFGLPQWVFGMATYGFADANTIVCTYTQNGLWKLAKVLISEGKLVEINQPYTSISDPFVTENFVIFGGGSAAKSGAIVRLDFATETIEVLKVSSTLDIDPGYLSEPQSIAFPTTGDRVAYALLYLPKNRDFQAPEGEKPPLKVKIHGGPTAQTSSSLNLSIQYWTSRGFAVLDVNYGGSTGYGRDYHCRLDGQWGIVDVDDCANGAQYLVDRGMVDGDRLTIAGGSAGGYTTLAALTFRDTFKAGASYYGVSDLEALARDTHKFESRYLDRLIGPYPERRDIYIDRSPIHHIDRLNCPVVFFQGLEDRVVPPNQAEMMVEALKKKGIPVAYVAFEGEQHGFRKAENIKRALDGEFYFYAKVFGFEPAETIEPIEIANL